MDLQINHLSRSTFYDLESRSDPIMSLANFPDDIFPLLQMEILMTFEAMMYFRCNLLIELGCYDGRALEIARQLNARYLGIDLNQRAIQLLQERIRREGMKGRAYAIVDDILNHGRKRKELGASRALYLLPFNLIGNFRDPVRLLTTLAKLNVAAVISVFSDSDNAVRVRQSYYRNSGVRDLDIQTKEDGVIFTGSDGFYSRSYSKPAFHALLSQCGLKIVRTNTNSLAHCATVQLDADV